MKCPMCKSLNNYVYGGKYTDCGNYMRYRRCDDCGHKFHTIEYYSHKVGADKNGNHCQ